ncbi:MAG TPA: sugar phosphate isomerase/epimerase [Armatimonadetes bacterium]|nr:sugar phosphate isomerase/epimerase [Armatimonadota bacterium]
MYRNLNPGMIGVQADLKRSLELAQKAGFEGLDVPLGEVGQLVEERGAGYVKDLYAQAGLKPGGWGMPINWRGSEGEFAEGLKQLARLAGIGAAIGATRVVTHIPPASEELPFAENFQFHQERFHAVAEVLQEHGCRLGLEFIGTKTLRLGRKYEFIYTLEGMLELCDAIGTGNVGLLLDCWHWYTSQGTVEALRQLTNEQVVYVHVNDAPAGVPVDEQIDNVRCLPGATGVIDIAGFLQALRDIGYDGPVTPEPFSREVNALPDEEAVRVTGEAMAQIWQLIGGCG